MNVNFEILNNESIAISDCDGNTLSYKELNNKIAIVSNSLLSQYKYNGIVCFSSEKCIDSVILILASIKSKLTYLPLDTSLPKYRIEKTIKENNISCVITFRSNPDILNDLDIVPTIDFKDLLKNKDSENFASETYTDNKYIYIMTTSGSTGEPKYIPVRYNVINNLVEWHINCFYQSNTKQKKALLFSPLYFDVSIQEILTTLANGDILIIPNETIRNNPYQLLSFIEEQKINNLFLPYSGLRLISDAFCSLDTYNYSFKLEYIFIAGEKAKITKNIKKFFKFLKNTKLVNQYGPTETHVITSYSLEENIDDWSLFPPIGIPIGGIECFLYKDNTLYSLEESKKKNITGELYIKSNSIFDGYVGNSSNSPFFFEDTYKYYKTEDIVRVNHSNNLEFIDRKGSIVKYKGYRVDLSAIESVLFQNFNIIDAVAALNEDKNEIISFVIPNTLLDKQNIINTLKKYLPSYMVPANIIFLDEFPVTRTGKHNKRKLLYDYNSTNNISRQNKKLAIKNIFAKALKCNIDELSFETGYFASGGDSLGLVELYTELSTTFPSIFAFEDFTKDDITLNRLLEIYYEKSSD